MLSNDNDKRLSDAFEICGKAAESGLLTQASARNIERWLREPQYGRYRGALVELLQSRNFEELNRLFWETIPFGTGGRRGPMSTFGSATINERTIAESAYGLATYVQKARESRSDTTSRQPRAVVAFDSRHRSEEFAKVTASILAATGFHVAYFPQPRSTPELSFSVRHLSCDTGVMISASHNPPCDNGFKAYWSTGGQVLPPHDSGIIRCVDSATEIPTIDFDDAVDQGSICIVKDDVDRAYVDAVCALSLSDQRDIRALYTPLHGVGETSVLKVAQQAGFQGVRIFEQQRTQDGNFPNVPDHLPNPERFAVFGPAIAEACRETDDLILASDPDADRMAVAVRSRPAWRSSLDSRATQDELTSDRQSEFVCLTGNQLGALLTDYVLDRRKQRGDLSDRHYIIETLVTTPMIAAIGSHYGVEVVRDVLVGFKHIAAEIDKRDPLLFVFAAEESIGFMAGTYCRDKDAAVGALFVLELAAELKRQGKTLLDRLDELYARHGYFHEDTVSTMCPGPTGQARIGKIMQAFRERPPAVAGGCRWESVRDFLRQERRQLPANKTQESIPAPSGDLLIFEGQSADCRVAVAMRPSGTEPKIKFYYFINTVVQSSLSKTKRRAAQCLADVQSAVGKWMEEV